MLYIGLPQWTHPEWVRQGFGIRSLADYARYFNCVEGDTTLYAVPSPEIVQRWRAQTHDDFRFCFKFPATITHKAALHNCGDLTREFLDRMSPLADRMGQFWIQLPARFGPEALPALWLFLDSLPGEFRYGVEVRHQAFFNRGEEERALNRGLHQRGVNRVVLDSRPVHSAAALSLPFREARQQKPKLPVHAVLTATDPMIRFISSADMTINRQLFSDWVNRLQKWQGEASPWLFLHTPDMALTPALIEALWPQIQQISPAIGPAPNIPNQISLL